MEEPLFRQCKRSADGGSTVSVNAISAQSMPVINVGANSTPSSPRRTRVPRCRSQPCVLTEPKIGMKRRRADDRPSINFKKMAEVTSINFFCFFLIFHVQ